MDRRSVIMKLVELTSKMKFGLAAASSMAMTFYSASVIPQGVILAWGTRILLIILCLPVAVMTLGLACLMPPEIMLIAALIFALVWKIPLQIVFVLAVLLAIGYLMLLFAGQAKFRQQPLPLIIYEFGADRIVPYYAWLISPRGAVFSGALCGVILGIAILWSKTMWHAVDSLSART